jgi:hypothetical protein
LRNIEAPNKPSPTQATKEKTRLASFSLDFAELSTEKHLLANEAASRLRKGKA